MPKKVPSRICGEKERQTKINVERLGRVSVRTSD